MTISKRFIKFIVFLLLILTGQAYGQIDSLEQQLQNLRGTDKHELLLKLSKEYWFVDLDKSLDYAEQALTLAEKSRDPVQMAEAYNRIGNVYYFQAENHKALENYNKSKTISQDANYQSGIAKASNNIGLIYNILGDYDEAIKNFHVSLNIEEKANNKKGIAISTINLGNLYVYIKNYTKAIDLYRKGLSISIEIDNKNGIIDAYTNLGSTYSELSEADSALKYCTLAYNLSLELDLKSDQATNLNNLGTIYFEKEEYDKARELFEKALKLHIETSDSWSEANTRRNIGGIYLLTNKYSGALPYFFDAADIAKEIQASKLLMDIYSAISETYELQNRFAEALNYIHLANKINDSIYSEESSTQIADMEARYSFRDKEQKLKLITKENEVNNLKIKSQRYTIYIFAISSLLILSLLLIVHLRSRTNKRARMIFEEKNTRITEQKILLEKTLSELKESEEKQKSLIENILDGIFIIQNKKLVYSNEIVSNILGYSNEEMHEMTFDDVIDPRDLKMISSNYKSRLKGVDIPKQYEIRLRHKNGNLINVNLNVGVIKLMGHLAIIGTIKDITAQKNHEAALIHEKDKAEQATKSKSIFLAGISHEIRNHMSSIIGISEVLSETELSEEQHEYADVIINSGNNMLSIINEILDFSKIEAGQVIIKQEEFKLSKLIKDVISAHKPQLKGKNVKLKSNIESNIPDNLIGDTTRIKQVLINLVSNAIKFTDKGKITINVNLDKTEQYKNDINLKFNVEDTGIGISEENQKKLFIPFSQTDNATERNISGTGLGLAICKNLVKLMNGTIGVSSEVDKGSVFWFTIKFKKQEPDHNPNESDNPDPDQQNPLNILLVEDNLMSQQLTKTILTKEGHKTDVADNGQIGLDMYINNNYDLVLMDIQMPVMDGIQASRLIREYEYGNGNDSVNIIAITAYTKEGEQQKLFDAGINLYLPKPFKTSQLLNMIYGLNLS